MKHLLPILLILCAACSQQKFDVRLIGHTPDEDTCYAKGVSAAGCAVVGNKLYLIGGANFPDVPVCQGGAKRFYDNIYSAELSRNGSKLTWKNIGNLPHPIAYGLTVATTSDIYIIGGANTSGSLSSVYRIVPSATDIQCDSLPSLPFAIDNMAGAAIGSDIYIAGGCINGKPSSRLFRLSTTDYTLQECTPIPGQPRTQPVCAAIGERLLIWGGFYQAKDTFGNVISDSCLVHTDGWCYDTQTQSWSKLPSPTYPDGTPITLSGASAISTFDGKILAAGGVNHDIFLDAIKGLYPSPEYQMHEPAWYHFNPYILLYDTDMSVWQILGQSQLTARVGSMMVALDAGAVLSGGETMPGIRSTDITLITR